MGAEWRVTGMFGDQQVDLVITPPAANRSVRAGATKVSTLSNEVVSEQVADIRSSLPHNLIGLADQMAVLFAESNKSGKVSESRLLREWWMPLSKAVESLPIPALEHGITVALAKPAANINYVKRAAEGFDAPAAVVMPTTRRRVLGGDHVG